MSTVPRLTERHPRLVELVFNDDPAVQWYRVGASNTLTGAFAGTTAMFDVLNPGTFRSPYIRSKRWGLTQYHNRGLSRAIYDPEDYWVAGGTLPHDADQGYLRVSPVDANKVVGAEGPIFVLPPHTFFTTPRPLMTLQGEAPDVAALPTGLPPLGSMHVVLPRFFDYCGITNKDAANSLWLSFGRGTPEIEIPFGTTKDIYDAADNEIIIRGQGGAVAFDAQFALVNGEMA